MPTMHPCCISGFLDRLHPPLWISRFLDCPKGFLDFPMCFLDFSIFSIMETPSALTVLDFSTAMPSESLTKLTTASYFQCDASSRRGRHSSGWGYRGHPPCLKMCGPFRFSALVSGERGEGDRSSVPWGRGYRRHPINLQLGRMPLENVIATGFRSKHMNIHIHMHYTKYMSYIGSGRGPLGHWVHLNHILHIIFI